MLKAHVARSDGCSVCKWGSAFDARRPLARCLRHGARIYLIELPTRRTWATQGLRAKGKGCRRHGARRIYLIDPTTRRTWHSKGKG